MRKTARLARVSRLSVSYDYDYTKKVFKKKIYKYKKSIIFIATFYKCKENSKGLNDVPYVLIYIFPFPSFNNTDLDLVKVCEISEIDLVKLFCDTKLENLKFQNFDECISS